MSNKFVYLLQKYSLFRFFILIVLFLLIGVCVVEIGKFSKVLPIVFSVEPSIYNKNEIITIIGKHFGEEAEDSLLKIDNVMIPSTLCNE